MTTKTYPAAFAAFEAANPDIAAWWTNTTFEFALSLRDQVLRGKVLSERQFAAAMKCVESNKARMAAKAAPIQAVSVDIDLVEKAFANAQGNGLTKPKMRLLGGDQAFVISIAPAHGRNAGSLYVKRQSDDAYMGRIFEGKFIRSSTCSDADQKDVVAACSAPEHSSVAYGRRFGTCSCCGRELTNALSIELGIGPICRGKFFG